MPWAAMNNSDANNLSTVTTTCTTNCGVNNVTYYLNGAGLRSFSFLHGWGGDIKIYVAKLYRTILEHLTTSESVYNIVLRNNNTPKEQMVSRTTVSHLLFEFTFLRNVNERRVADAWKYQLHHSISKEFTLYPEYHSDRKMFVHAFGPIQSGGTVSIALLSNGDTYLFDPGYSYKKTITGHQFQLAFVSMWIGMQPVTSELKRNLLGSYNSTFGSVHLANVSMNQQHMNQKTDKNVCMAMEDG